MNAHESYFKAVVPDPVTILGLELRPFCAGHIVLLHRINSVFIRGGTVTENDLRDAVFICAHSFREGIKALNDESTVPFYKRWKRQISKVNLAQKIAEFEKYIADGSQFDLIFAPKQQSQHIPITSLPAVHTIRCRLMSYYGVKSDEFWDMPWGQAQWDFYTAFILEGQGDLVEKDTLQAAKDFAEADFKRMNPHLFNADGTRKDLNGGA